MKTIKRTLCAVCAFAVLVTAMLMAGCSTPAVAMTVGDYQCSTGEYLANMYSVYYNAMYNQGLYQYQNSGTDVWSQELPIEGDDGTEIKVKLDEYVKLTAQDNIVRQEAVRQIMAENGVTVPDADIADLDEQLSSVKESEMIKLGFSKENYRKMYINTGLNEQALFKGIYGEGGKKAVSEDELRDFFNNNYLSYKIVSVALVDDSGKPFTDEQVAAVDARLQGYMDMYNMNHDFDAVIAKADEDTKAIEAAAQEAAAAEDPENPANSGGTVETSSVSVEDETTAQVATVTTAADAEGVAAAPAEDLLTADGEGVAAAPAEDLITADSEGAADANLKDFTGAEGEDQYLMNAVKNVPVGSVSIQRYSAEGTTDTAALIYRLDPTEVHGKTYFEDSKESILTTMKYDEYDKAVKEKADALPVTKDERAIRMCDPKNFEKDDK